jgi:hypothetical protein
MAAASAAGSRRLSLSDGLLIRVYASCHRVRSMVRVSAWVASVEWSRVEWCGVVWMEYSVGAEQ